MAAATAALLAASGCGSGSSASEDADESAAGLAPVARAAASIARADPPPARRVPGEVLVRFRPAAQPRSRAAAASRAGARVLRDFPSARGLSLLRLPEGADADAAIAELRRSPEVLHAEPNHVIRAAALPDDPRFAELWGLRNTGQTGGAAGVDIGAERAWEVTTGSAAPVVVVVDSGIDYGHPDLAANMRRTADCDRDGVDDDGDGYADDCHGIDTVANDSDPMDEDGHGTHVAGIIGAVGNNGLGVTGVAWRASLLACRVLDANGNGTMAGALACLDWVAVLKDRGVNVVAVNASWGGVPYSAALADAVDDLGQRGILFVAAAGNDGVDLDVFPEYPCALDAPNVICVAASDAGGSDPAQPGAPDLAAFSDRGAHTVHLAAPGVRILSTVPVARGSYEARDGTSMSAAYVTGAVALVHARHPGADVRAVRGLLLSTGAPLGRRTSAAVVAGRQLDVHGALTCVDAAVTRRLSPAVDDLTSTGRAPLYLSVLSVRCGQPAAPVAVAVDPGGPVVLRDDGTGGDARAGDGVYSAWWQPPRPGTYALTFPRDGQAGATPDVVRFVADGDLEDGFPVRMLQRAGTSLGGAGLAAVVGDIDGDPEQEIVLPELWDGPIHAFDPDGGLVPGWPVRGAGRGTAQPALARLSRARPGLQVVVGYSEGGLVAYDGAGRILPGWPPRDRDDARHPAAPLAVDANGDGLDEVFALGAFRGDGAPLNPRSHPDGGEIVPQTGAGSPAAADLDGDGGLELVSPSDVAQDLPGPRGRLDAFQTYGPPVAGFGAEFAPYPRTYPVIGDVDGDGRLEIALFASGGIQVYAGTGRLERLLPVAEPAGDGSALALADLDGDGAPELVYQTAASVGVVRGDGTPLDGWPVATGAGWTQGNGGPVVGDLDGDGSPEIVAVTTRAEMGRVHALRSDGSPLPRFPKVLRMGAGMTPAIADLDGDGRNELVVAGTPWRGADCWAENLWVYDLGGAPRGPVPWGQFMGNARHTGTAVPPVGIARTLHTLTASAPLGGTIRSDPPGISCSPVCLSSFVAGTAVTLTAVPAPDHELAAWSGACAGQPAACTVVLDADAQLGAEFVRPLRRLTVRHAGAGAGSIVSTSPAGIDCGATCEASFLQGTEITLAPSPAEGSRFAGWSGACAGEGACTLTLSADAEAVARFERSGGGGGGSGGGGCASGDATSVLGLSAAALLLRGRRRGSRPARHPSQSRGCAGSPGTRRPCRGRVRHQRTGGASAPRSCYVGAAVRARSAVPRLHGGRGAPEGRRWRSFRCRRQVGSP